MVFMPVVIIRLISYEYIVPDLTRQAFDNRKVKVSADLNQSPKMIEIEKLILEVTP